MRPFFCELENKKFLAYFLIKKRQICFFTFVFLFFLKQTRIFFVKFLDGFAVHVVISWTWLGIIFVAIFFYNLINVGVFFDLSVDFFVIFCWIRLELLIVFAYALPFELHALQAFRSCLFLLRSVASHPLLSQVVLPRSWNRLSSFVLFFQKVSSFDVHVKFLLFGSFFFVLSIKQIFFFFFDFLSVVINSGHFVALYAPLLTFATSQIPHLLHRKTNTFLSYC